MPSVKVDNSPAIATRKQDISSWGEVDITKLRSKQKRRFYQKKSAIVDYFTTDVPIEEITLRHDISFEQLEKLAKKCLRQHEDGTPWGFRALLPITRTTHPPSSPAQTEEVPLQENSEHPEYPACQAQIVSTQANLEIADAQFTMPSQPAELPIAKKSRYQLTAKKLILARHFIQKRSKAMLREQRLRRIVSTILISALLFTILLPLGAGLAGYSVYNNIRGLVYDGINHLLDVKNVLTITKNDPTAALNIQTLQRARNDFSRAEGDFVQMQQFVSRPEVQNTIEQFAPNYYSKLGMAQRLIQVGLDVSHMGSEMTAIAFLGANVLHGSPLASASTKPLITVGDVADAEGAMIHALYYIDDIRTQMSQVSLKDLPISDKQQTQLTSMLSLLPRARDLIIQAQGLTGIVAWLLGVGQARRFLIQTMDRAELRPGGGFTGQYGVLQIQDGRMAPFVLHDVNQIDYNGNGVELYRQAPPEYRSWMNFGNWGLRDSNLSADYPTTARIGMQVFQEEGGGPVDADISFTPTLISHILEVTGPIYVAEYHETITSKNLEDRLHYYQQNFNAIAVQEQKTGVKNASARKTFTTLLGRLLLDRVRHLQVKQLLSLAKSAVKDIQSRDLEIYFANPAAEAWLVEHAYSGAMDTYMKQDGFMVVQANISISKASQYVHTTEQDNITLDAQGGATHVLTITLDYTPTGPVYGYDTYADYIRVYAPPTAQFLWGDGFDTGQALCTPGTTPIPPPPPPAGTTNGKGAGGTGGTTGSGTTSGNDTGCDKYKTSFPSNARYCPNGNYDLGQHGFIAGKGPTYWPIDSLGNPTALSSDLPGRSMWGGLTETPKNCSSYITLSWYVPHVVKNLAGQSPYSLLIQKQGGYIPTVQITIETNAVPIKGVKPFDFAGDLTADRIFALPALKKK